MSDEIGETEQQPAAHDYWQRLLPASAPVGGAPFRASFPARLPDGRQLLLPIRALSDGTHGLASLILNQASFAVVEALAAALAEKLRTQELDLVVGLPTLGLSLAAPLAQKLGHSRYLPCGTSRKFWYDESLSVPISSVTTETVRRLYLDPRLVPLLEGRRVALVDDVISTGRSLVAGLELLKRCGCEPVAIGAAMLQSDRWHHQPALRDRADHLHAVVTTPLLHRVEGGWAPVET